MNIINTVNELNNIELFEFSNPSLNDKKKKIKKIILYTIGIIVYSISIVSSSFGIADFFKINELNCTC